MNRPFSGTYFSAFSSDTHNKHRPSPKLEIFRREAIHSLTPHMKKSHTWVLTNDGVRGDDGRTGSSGMSGSGAGASGQSGGAGTPGNRGTDAGNIDLHLSASADQHQIVSRGVMMGRTHFGGSDQTEMFEMGVSTNGIRMSAVGGAGGTGGCGGRGGNGATGYHGRNATRHSSGTNGGPGGHGGRGGDGGSGGNGGNGGNITVHLSEKDMDLIMLLDQQVSETRGGFHGTGGSGGIGGSGGSGGPGGSSYSWTETHGSGDNRHTTHHSNPGGHRGPNGSPGSSGSSGRSGYNGSDAVYRIDLLSDEGHHISYDAPSKLRVSDPYFYNVEGWGVFEPASNVELFVDHENEADMPTPKHQAVEAYVADNQWVNCKSHSELSRSMPYRLHERISVPIRLSITDVLEPTLGNPFAARAKLEHLAYVTRVGKFYEQVSQVTTGFDLRYAAEMSGIKGPSSISVVEEAPVVFCIDNVSLLHLGAQTEKARVLRTSLQIDYDRCVGPVKITPSDLVLRDCDGKTLSTERPVNANILDLTQSDQKFLTASMGFLNTDIPPYTRIALTSSLFLGHPQDYSREVNVQNRQFEIQLAEAYVLDPSAEVLLIVNNRTSYEMISGWRKLLISLNLNFNTWNVSLYQDLALDFTRQDGSSLLKDFSNKLMIILNNEFIAPDNTTKINTVEMTRWRELFLAAREHNIHTLVMGLGVFQLETEMLPSHFTTIPPVLFRDADQLLRTLDNDKLESVGEGAAIGAEATSDLCGVMLVLGSPRWLSMDIKMKTLCIYTSAKQSYPDQTLSLESFRIQEERFEGRPSLRLIDISENSLVISEPLTKSQWESKDEKYSGRMNYTRPSLDKWKTVLTPLSMSSDAITCKGHLLRQNSEDQWETGYYELDSLLGAITYKKEGEFQLPETFYLGKYYWIKCGSQENDGENFFPFDIFTEDHPIPFAATTKRDRDAWMNALQRVSPSAWYHADTLIERLASLDFTPKNFSAAVDNFSVLFKGFSDQRQSHAIRKDVSSEEGKKLLEAQKAGTNLVAHFPVTGRFVFSEPSSEDIAEAAREFSEKLKARYPTRTYTVAYHYDPVDLTFGLKRLGELYVYRSLNKNVSQLGHCLVGDFTEERNINTPSTMFSVVKGLPFESKLKLLDMQCKSGKLIGDLTGDFMHVTDASNNLHVTLSAIVSDIFMEQEAFRNSSGWNAGLDSKLVYKQMKVLATLRDHHFKSLASLSDSQTRLESPFGRILSEIGFYVYHMMDLYTTVGEKILLGRRCTTVNEATEKMWNDILHRQLGQDMTLTSSQMKDISERRKRNVEGFTFDIENYENILRLKDVAKWNNSSITLQNFRSCLDKQSLFAGCVADKPFDVKEQINVFKSDEDRLRGIENLQIKYSRQLLSVEKHEEARHVLVVLEHLLRSERAESDSTHLATLIESRELVKNNLNVIRWISPLADQLGEPIYSGDDIDSTNWGPKLTDPSFTSITDARHFVKGIRDRLKEIDSDIKTFTFPKKKEFKEIMMEAHHTFYFNKKLLDEWEEYTFRESDRPHRFEHVIDDLAGMMGERSQARVIVACPQRDGLDHEEMIEEFLRQDATGKWHLSYGGIEKGEGEKEDGFAVQIFHLEDMMTRDGELVADAVIVTTPPDTQEAWKSERFEMKERIEENAAIRGIKNEKGEEAFVIKFVVKDSIEQLKYQRLEEGRDNIELSAKDLRSMVRYEIQDSDKDEDKRPFYERFDPQPSWLPTQAPITRDTIFMNTGGDQSQIHLSRCILLLVLRQFPIGKPEWLTCMRVCKLWHAGIISHLEDMGIHPGMFNNFYIHVMCARRELDSVKLMMNHPKVTVSHDDFLREVVEHSWGKDSKEGREILSHPKMAMERASKKAKR
ncbi:hypothetical protein PROFUN_07896 [Planoprotostelium fungivorum]|uniref:PH domain-containing protein n=1 Tax=Planoprotostelium fungivorum TaxID=1890364 RepID=A0A2P6NL36_9EUKA|nr:hypothetical protein PROFUN_07896 [Planoprotostelium fungivorum]